MVDTTNLSSVLQGENQVIVTQLTSDQLTPLAENIMSNDDGTVVALGLADYQVHMFDSNVLSIILSQIIIVYSMVL